MLETVRTALRLKSHAYDTEISGLIAACIADLRLAGIKAPDIISFADDATTGDPLIDQAILLYAKANFGFNSDSERYNKSYEYLKCSLSLAGGYNGMG